MNLLNNVFTNFSNLRNDFTGSLDIHVFFNFLICLLISFLIIFVTYVFGRKISEIFKIGDQKKDYNYLIHLGVGYVLISSGIAILGFFNQLKPLYIATYLLAIFIISFGFPFNLITNLKQLYYSLAQTIKTLKGNKIVLILIILFIFMALVNLLNPEIREDQYHTDFARLYLKEQTINIPPKEVLQVSASPMLPEMYYVVGVFLYSKEIPRYINFLFYILVLLTLISFSKVNQYKFSIYTPLLFASAPVVIKETSSGYTDFVWIFFFLLSTLILIDYKESRIKYLLSGIFLGAGVSGKLWTIVMYPLYITFVTLKNLKERFRLRYLFIFIIASLAPLTIWLLRAFILTANPLFPAFGNSLGTTYKLTDYFGINYALFNPKYFINVFSPVFFIGLIFLLVNFRNNLKILFKLDIVKIFSLVFLTYFVIHYPYGRYLLGVYIFFIFLSSLGITNVIAKFKWSSLLINFSIILVFIYYFINSILVVPYALGMANTNNYISRILLRDNSSYYDFGGRFNKFIGKDDIVGMYNFHGYYYVDFDYIDTSYIFDKNNKSFDLLKKKGVTKLLIRGGDIGWFCKNLRLTSCTINKISLVSNYSVFPFYYLYNIK